jgi:uncharacterized membrane protein
MMERLSFRWGYVVAPLAVLLLSIILSAYFYHLLPAEVAYHFEFDGTPDRWLGREMTMVLALVPQLFLTLLACGVTWGAAVLSNRFGQVGSRVRPESVVLFMGNLIAAPQFIIGFAMVDIFGYNSYQIHIMPMWIFLLAILGLVTIGLGILGVLIFLKLRE